MSRGRSGPTQISQAALALFADRGVHATSLQMIADRLGVTKAAVYHHFKSKQGIVEAVLAPALDDLRDLTEAAEQLANAAEQQELVVRGLAEGAVRHRAIYAVVLRDLTAIATVARTRELWDRLHDLLAGEGASPTRRVQVAMFLSGLVAPAIDAHVGQMSDQEIHDGILHVGLQLV